MMRVQNEQLASRLFTVEQRNAELHSLRCDTTLKLSIAREFQDDGFHFPWNVDFRGRAYPLPPNLSHIGSDLCRGMLMFDEKKPLGARGFEWLKVHLANLYGHNKLTFAERVAFVDQKIGEGALSDAAARPLDGAGWWKEASEPWQALATCMEIHNAMHDESGDPTRHASGLPVQMDGSCNGLQHYAALGRDVEGAFQVNVSPSDRPQDVYSAVCDIVASAITADAATPLESAADDPELAKRIRHARLVSGLIDRKVVKQTVMTSVYGVTFVGARNQIYARLFEKLEAEGRVGGVDEEDQVLEKELFGAAAYVARQTMDAMAQLFTSARAIMDWLATCARLVAREGHAMSWVTPLGLPVVQPYRNEKKYVVKTMMQSVVLVDHSDALPVSLTRQRSAFPPNFVHSLDSSHMLMTAVEMERRGLTFTAVHDSYWTHARDVDQMGDCLRAQFVQLYSQPLLEELYVSIRQRYPSVEVPPVPARGALDISTVRSSAYFFS